MPSEVCAHSVMATLESTRVSSSTAIAYCSDVPPAPADLLGERDPHPAQLPHRRDERVRERLRAVQLLGHRRHLLLREVADGALEQAGLVGEVEVHGRTIGADGPGGYTRTSDYLMTTHLDTDEQLDAWRRAYARTPERDAAFTTLSGEPVAPLYTEADLPDPAAIGLPGAYPFTRGVYPSMYRGRLWTMRQFAGFGTAEETNARFRYLLDHGQTGLSTAFDMPSLMGHDSDSPRSLGEVGREGVAVDTLDDMETLFGGIDLGAVSVSMTINAPAAIMLAFYVVAAEAGGVPRTRLGGTIQADILKEYIAQKEWCFPVDPAMRLLGDMIEWSAHELPRWHPVSISGYHIREAGSTAAQELAFTLKDGLTYVQQAVDRGLDVDAFAPRLSFFFNAQIDFFEEIAKYRAARRIWARELRETFGAKDPRSWLMRFHTQTAGVSLTAQQPLNNVVRTAIEALAGVLGGHPVAAHELLRRGARAAHGGRRCGSRCARSR